jgi:hypothetical protein
VNLLNRECDIIFDYYCQLTNLTFLGVCVLCISLIVLYYVFKEFSDEGEIEI